MCGFIVCLQGYEIKILKQKLNKKRGRLTTFYFITRQIH